MPAVTAVIPESLLLNRRSCEEILSRKALAKADLDLNHRSIHSDPGVRFSMMKNMDLNARLRPDLRSVVLRPDPGNFEFHRGQTDLFHSMLKYQSVREYWNNSEKPVCHVSCQRTRQRGCQFDPQLNAGKVVSTSLSSSATSLYSDDETTRSSAGTPSDCPSVISRNSFLYPDDEQNHQNRNDNNNNFDAKINESLFNLNNNCQEDKTVNEKSNISSRKNEKDNSAIDYEQSRDILSDHEEGDYEHYALSDHWFLEEGGRRWIRIDGKESMETSPSESLSRQLGGLDVEDGDCGDNSTPRLRLNTAGNNNSRFKTDPSLIDSQAVEGVRIGKPVQKTKSGRFLKRFGGDLKKLSSFKKTYFVRSHSNEASLEDPSHYGEKGQYRSLRSKNCRFVIGEPTLQEENGQLTRMKCVPVEHVSTEYERKNSSHSLISTSSSGGTCSSSFSKPHPAFEITHSDYHGNNEYAAHEEATVSRSATLTEKDAAPNNENSVFFLHPSYKPGSFPKAIRNRADETDDAVPFSSVSSSRSQSGSDFAHSASQQRRPASVYDNLQEAGLGTLSQDFLNIFDLLGETEFFEDSSDAAEDHIPGVDVAFWSVDDIVEHTQSLQQMVGSWGDEEDLTGKYHTIVERPSTENSPSCSESTSATEEDCSMLYESKELSKQIQSKLTTLKRQVASPCARTGAADQSQLQVLSAGQLMVLRRLAVLKLTASMEKFNHKSSNSWSVPRFIRRFKVSEYKDKVVFGVPLLHIVQKFGQALPPCILNALDYLRKTALGQVGIFRKPGVRVRIQNLRAKCEANPRLNDFEDFTACDVADLVKQYFRELPDTLMTTKMSDTFVGIFSNIAENLRLPVLQAALLLLPDENREALKTLLHFLVDVAAKVEENQMNANNLSTCLAPSLFHLQINSTKITASSSPKLRKSQSTKLSSSMKPNLKEMNDNLAATQCLSFMIGNITDLFKVQDDVTTQCRLSVMEQPEDVLTSVIGCRPESGECEDYFKDFHSHVDQVVSSTLKEEQKFSQNKLGSWQAVGTSTGPEIYCKKVNDGNPLRLWRSRVEVNGDADQVLERILHERDQWDEDLVQFRIRETPDDRTEVHQTVVKEMSSLPSRDYCVLRTWRKNAASRGSIVVFESSTGHQPLLGDVRGVVLTSRYVIEPSNLPKKCSLTRICRIDTKGRNPEWYNKSYGYLVARDLAKIQKSFQLTQAES